MATVYQETGVEKMREAGGSLPKSLWIESKTLVWGRKSAYINLIYM